MAEQPAVNRQVLGSSPSQGAISQINVNNGAMFTAIQRSWRIHSLPISILRLWLGVTWIYAGWHKATDPGFLTKGANGYIGSQLARIPKSSPLNFALNKLVENADLMGLVAMISEFAIGLATLSGFMLVYAALGGLIMSLTLWLTLSWTVSPYFLGSNSAYVIMWAVLLGSIFRKSGRLRLPNFSDRREVLTLALLGGLSIIGVIAGKNFKRGPKKLSSAGSSNAIAKVSDIAIGTSINIVDTFGAPAIIFRTKSGVYAYSAVCTHQGCTVEFDKNSKHLICPCHGAEYDPANSAKVLAGPTTTPLPKVKISVKGDEIFLI